MDVADPARKRLGVTQQQLDFLRGLAAVFVVLYHARGSFFVGTRKFLADDPSAFDYLWAALLQSTQFGIECVVLFFVLSGFAMAHSIKLTRSVPSFYLKRLIRIWPPYLVATLLGLLVGIVIGSRDIQENALQIAFYINIDPNNSVVPQFWSLPYEVVFYLLCPLLLSGVGRVRWLFAASAVLTAIYVALLGPGMNVSNFAFNFAGNELLFFASGAMAYHHFERVPRLPPWIFGGLVAAGLAAVWAIKLLMGDSSVWSNLIVVALAVLAIRNLPPSLAATKPLNLGFFSYSIYIFHYAFIALAVWASRRWLGIEPGEITHPFAWVLIVPVVLGACYSLYLVTEAPCNRIVASLRRRS